MEIFFFPFMLYRESGESTEHRFQVQSNQDDAGLVFQSLPASSSEQRTKMTAAICLADNLISRSRTETKLTSTQDCGNVSLLIGNVI